MKQKIHSATKQFLRDLKRKDPVALGVLLAALVAVFLIVAFGVNGLLIVLIGAILFIAGIIILRSMEKSLEELTKQRESLADEITLAEKKYMKHKMDKEAYVQLNEENQKKLITIEAEIEARKVETKIDEKTKKEEKKLNTRRRHRLKELLKEKEMIFKEMKVARKKFLKRKIDEKTYSSAVGGLQKKLVNVEVAISGLYKEEAKDIMRQTNTRLKAEKQREQTSATEYVARDIYDQVKED